MPAPMIHQGASIQCTHAAPVTGVASSPRVLVSGMPVVTVTDQFTVAGCPFQVPIGTGTKPQPCVRVQWTVPAVRVLAGGQPVLTSTSTGLCLSAEQIPQGPPTPTAVQPRVVAT